MGKKTGLALEGGGAKGAFHIGAVKALLDEGWTFESVAGTSIGAFNGALLAQGDFSRAWELWNNMDISAIFDLEESQIKKILSGTIDRESLLLLTSLLKDTIENGGVDTGKIKALLEEYVSEEKLRASSTDFGLVTVSLTDLKPVELYKEDIPNGLLTSYIMASANFPVFKLEPVEGKTYIDGGFYDNCPINMLARKGCERVVAIRTLGMGINRRIEDESLEVVNILPSEDLGRILYFDQETLKRNIALGYFDTLRILKKLEGERYYLLDRFNEEEAFRRICDVDEKMLFDLMEVLKIKGGPSRRIFFERIIPRLCEYFGLKNEEGYSGLLLRIVEKMSEKYSIERLRIYSLEELVDEIRKARALTDQRDVREPKIRIRIQEKVRSVILERTKEHIYSEAMEVFFNGVFRGKI